VFKKLLISLIVSAVFLGQFSAMAAVKTGGSCTKLGATSTSLGKKYTCIKSGKKLVWNKGVPVIKPVPVVSPTASPTPIPTPTPTSSPTPTSAPFVEGGSCEKMGTQEKDSSGLLECRKIVGNKLIYVRITNKFDPVVNPVSPDPLTTCQLPDRRTTKLWPRPVIAYPPVPIGDFKPTGNFKVIVAGFDFSDAVGTAKPSTYWDTDLPIVDDWLKWYSNDKVKYNYVKVDKWLRAPLPAAAYENQNETDKTGSTTTFSAGGVSDKQKSDSFLKILEAEVDSEDPVEISRSNGVGCLQILLNNINHVKFIQTCNQAELAIALIHAMRLIRMYQIRKGAHNFNSDLLSTNKMLTFNASFRVCKILEYLCTDMQTIDQIRQSLIKLLTFPLSSLYNFSAYSGDPFPF
jgi:hypothetical protein